MGEQRRLAAIMSADVVGYSRMMGRDESGTLRRLLDLRKQYFEPALARHHGRLVKLVGDGALVEFPSAVGAVSAAIEFQQAVTEDNTSHPAEEPIIFRIGVHLGDLIVKGDDLYGDGVNIAARLEAEAPMGGILLSRTVRDAVRGRLRATFEDLGALTLKNIERPVRAFRVNWSAAEWSGLERAAMGALATRWLPHFSPDGLLPLPDKPSIAVLPFQNMSGDADQEYFVDGLVEDIITALSRFRSLFVIARNSSFAYKGKSPDIRQVGIALGVRYVLEGSIRKAANRVRISGQLIAAASGAHLWADRFEGILDDVFDLQDQVTKSVVGAVAPELERAEIERAQQKPTDSLDAYDCYLRGLACVHRETRESITEALTLFQRATELAPEFATPYGMTAWCYNRRKSFGWSPRRAGEVVDTARVARRAAETGRDDAIALSFGGIGLAYVVGDLDDGAAMIDRACWLNPNLAAAWNHSGWVRAFLGQPEAAVEHQLLAMRLSPLDPLMSNMEGGTALAHFVMGQYDAASSWAERALHDQPTFASAMRTLAASYAMAGRMEQARKALARLQWIDPGLRISDLPALLPFRRPDDLARFIEGLRRAGLPE